MNLDYVGVLEAGIISQKQLSITGDFDYMESLYGKIVEHVRGAWNHMSPTDKMYS